MDISLETKSGGLNRGAGGCGWILPEGLRELAAGGDEEIVAEVLRDFETDTLERLTRLRAALRRGQTREAGAQAHAIKGGAVQVGAYGLAELCRRMERLAHEEADLSSAAGELELEFAVLRNVIARGAGG